MRELLRKLNDEETGIYYSVGRAITVLLFFGSLIAISNSFDSFYDIVADGGGYPLIIAYIVVYLIYFFIPFYLDVFSQTKQTLRNLVLRGLFCCLILFFFQIVFFFFLLPVDTYAFGGSFAAGIMMALITAGGFKLSDS